MNGFFVLPVLLLAPAVMLAQQPLKVGTLSVSEPATITKLNTGDLKGQPGKLAWSDDGKALYLQTLDGPRTPTAKMRHYVVSTEDGRRTEVSEEPAWAKASWAAKSDRSSPDKPSFLIEIASSTRRARGVSSPMGGDMARGGVGGGGDIGGGGGGTSAGDVAGAASDSQTAIVYAMKLGGQTIGEFVNTPIVPGQTFGWGPKGTGVIAFASVGDGRIVIMDVAGKTQALAFTKDASLPAFSPDGRRLAWLRKDGSKSFKLQISQID